MQINQDHEYSHESTQVLITIETTGENKSKRSMQRAFKFKPSQDEDSNVNSCNFFSRSKLDVNDTVTLELNDLNHRGF